MSTTIENVKLLIGLNNTFDSDTDSKLLLIIQHATQQVLSYLPDGTTEVPNVLLYIVEELAVKRFNRIGNEAMQSYSEEGESISYSESDMTDEYRKSIQAYINTTTDARKGVLRFL